MIQILIPINSQKAKWLKADFFFSMLVFLVWVVGVIKPKSLKDFVRSEWNHVHKSVSWTHGNGSWVLFFPKLPRTDPSGSGPLHKLYSSATVRNFIASLVSWRTLGVSRDPGSVQWFLRKRAGARGCSERRQQNYLPCLCSGHKRKFCILSQQKTCLTADGIPLCCILRAFQKGQPESQATIWDWVSLRGHSGMIKTSYAARMNGAVADGEAKYNPLIPEMTLWDGENSRDKRPLKMHVHITGGGKDPGASGNFRSETRSRKCQWWGPHG